MKKSVLFFVCLILLVGFVAADEWKVLGASEERVVGAAPQELKIEITVPECQVRKVQVNDKECVVISMPRTSYHMVRGFPMIPKLTRLVKLDHAGPVQMRVLSIEEDEVPLEAPIVPSKGHFTRDIPYESVPFEFGPIYHQNVFWPSAEEQFQIGEPFMFRSIRGVRIQILPVRANHVTMRMKVLRRAVILLTFEGGESRTLTAEREVLSPSKTFSRFYGEFLNYSATTQTERGGSVPPENNKKLVVVTPTKFEGLLGNWLEWKKKAGYSVTVKSVADGTTASTIKSYLQGLYDNPPTRFGYVVLIGDAKYASNFETAQPMPTFKGKYEGAAADRVYVRLAGNDNYPDAFISRISGETDSHITAQLTKFVNYEQNGTWTPKGICIASNQGSPTDKDRAEWLQNGGGSGQKVPTDAGGLIKAGYSYFDDIYDPSASAAQVTNAVNAGRSVICYIGHGSSTSWGTTGFNGNQAKSLTNAILPHIWSVACVNGDFVKTAECFAESWLRNPNGGAIAMEAASTNEAWVPPCDKQAAVVNAIIRRSHITFGALEAVGCVKGLEVWGDTDSGQGNQMAEQCNLFGDCTMLLKNGNQLAMTVQATRTLDRQVAFSVTSEGRAQAEATVTVYTQDLSYLVTADTDEAGNATISLENMPDAPLFYTVVGADLIPIVDQPLN